VGIYGKYDQFDLSEISHDYPEWKKYENDIKESSGKKPHEMSFIDFFDNPETLTKSNEFGIKDDPFKEEASFLKILKEDFNENT
jgi:hypothetical protein